MYKSFSKKILFLLPLLIVAILLYRTQKQDEKIVQTPAVRPSPYASPSAEFNTHHYPSIDGETVKAVPYLTLPFRSTDPGVPSYDITEGWFYSQEELDIHNADRVHHGIDFAVPYNTPVVAPADGYAIASYYAYKVKNPDGSYRLHQGKYIWMGLGYFVRLYVPKVNRFVTMGHLSELSDEVIFSPPEWAANIEMWIPANQNLSVDQWKNSPDAVFVTRGTELGKVGYSGLGWGFDDYDGSGKPVIIDHTKNVSWDEPHVHFEEFWFDQTDFKVHLQRDMMGIYGYADDYPTALRKRLLGKDPLFLLDSQGHPLFADQ
jgi:hypothetical protein